MFRFVNSALLTLCVVLPLAAEQPVIYDIILAGGHVIDPKNERDGVYDIGIVGDRIVKVAENLPAAHAKKLVDVSGYLVTPGLIDLHGHFDVHGPWLSVNPGPYQPAQRRDDRRGRRHFRL